MTDTPGTAVAPRTSSGVRLVTIAVMALAFVACVRTLSNADIWTHMASGKAIMDQGLTRVDPLSSEITEGAYSWVNPNWLYDVVLYGAWHLGGGTLVTLLHALMAALAIGLAMKASRGHASVGMAGLAAVLCIWLAAPMLIPGAILVGTLFAAIFMMRLLTPGSALAVWGLLIPLQIVWTNINRSFPLGVVIAALFAIQARFDRRMDPKSRPSAGWGLVAALALATVVNPYFLRLHMANLRDWFDPVRNIELAWLFPFTGTLGRSPLVWGVLGLIVAAFLVIRQRMPIALTTLGVLSAYLMFRIPAHMALCGVLAIPFLSLALSALLGEHRGGAIPPRFEGVSAVMALLAVVISAGLFASNAYYNRSGTAARFGFGIESDVVPTTSAKVVMDPAFPKSIVNLGIDGGYLALQFLEGGATNRRVFCDTRANVFGVRFYAALDYWLRGGTNAWTAIQRNTPRPAAIVLNCTWPGAGEAAWNLLGAQGWHLAWFDGTTAILLKPTAAVKSLLTNEALQREGLEILERERRDYAARLDDPLASHKSMRLIGAGHFYMGLRRYGQAEAVYALIARGMPEYDAARLYLAIAQTELGKADSAIANLLPLRRAQPDDVRILVAYARACKKAGQNAEAEAAAARIKALDTRAVDAITSPWPLL